MRLRLPYYPAIILQLAVPLLLLWLARFAFSFYNADALGNPSFGRVLALSFTGLKFDLCAWAWFNAPFILLRFLPFEFVNRKGYRIVANTLYFISNLLLLLPALADIPFFRYNGSHLRWTSISTIFTDPNIHGILLSFTKDYWGAYAVGVLLVIILWWAAFRITPSPLPWLRRDILQAFLLRLLVFIVAGASTFICIRGHLGPGRPLSIGDAIWGTSKAPQLNIVLNTPFCIIRTLHNDNRVEQFNFFPPEKLAALHSSLHTGSPAASGKKRNIVVLTIESGSAIWVDSINPVAGDTLRGLMPFLDSLATKSVVFPRAYTTGVRSIEGITAIFGGVPTFNDMILMTSPYYANTFDAPASLLADKGYSSRFYFGGNKGSFNIDQTLKTFGFEKVVSREDYGNDNDFDGAWGIWDHKMGEFAARDISSLPQPFIAGWFTLNPHGPFDVPSDWNTDGYKAKDNMRRTVEYEDRAIRHFFEVAKGEPWYDNTLFLIIGDHGSRDLRGTVYDSPAILPRITMMLYSPDGSLSPAIISDRSVAQYDIPSTLLTLAGYPDKYVSLGENVLSENHPGYALMFIKGAYRVCGTRYAVSLSPDLRKIEGVYDINSDYEMKDNLSRYDAGEVKRMIDWARAFMQDYSTRLNGNTLSYKK